MKEKTPQNILDQSREEIKKLGNLYKDECWKLDYPKIKSFLTSTLQAFLEAEIARLEERVKYIDTYRSGKNEQDFRSGWSGLESGECCDKYRMEDKHFDGRADALKAVVGCRNPFQLKDVCECHIPFRKVAAKVERRALQDQISHLKELTNK